MKDGYVKIASFPEPLSANLAKTKLESEGIEVFIANENTIRMDFLYSQLLGGVQLWVPEGDAARAAQLLSEDASKEVESIESKTPHTGGKCPKCGSENTSAFKRPNKFGITSFFLGLPLPFFKRTLHCYHCGHKGK